MSRKDQIIAMLSDSPKDAFLRFALAKELEKEGDLPGARRAYEELLTDSPNEPGTFYHLGKVLERLEEGPEANRIYELGIKTTKDLGEQHAMRELMGARMELGLFEDDDDDDEA